MRIAFHIALILSALFLPWWVTAVLLAAACLALDAFYEAIIYGIALDALYGSPFGVHGYEFIWTASALVLFIACLPIRRRLAW